MQKSRVQRGLAEVVLIIVGVLIAFALDSWWERLQDRSSETAHLVAIRTDFEGAAFAFDSLAASAEGNVRSLGALLELLADDQVVTSADTVLVLAERLWFWQRFTNRMPAYAEFLDDVGLSGVSDDQLRRALYRYESALDAHREWEGYMSTAQISLWKPTFLDLMPAPHAGAAVGGFDPGGLASDRGFLNVVAERRQVEDGLQRSRRDVAAAARGVVDRIDATLVR